MGRFQLASCTYGFSLPNQNLASSQVEALLASFAQNQPGVTVLELDLSGNRVNEVPFFNGPFSLLAGLQPLNLSNNGIGGDAARALAQNLGLLSSLTVLNLNKNLIGQGGLQPLAQSLPSLQSLTEVDLADNSLGSKAGNETQAVLQSLSRLPGLTTLDLRDNAIGSLNPQEIETLANSIGFLPSLSQFYFLPQQYSLSAAQIQRLNTALARINATLIPLPLTTSAEVAAYLQGLSINTTWVNLTDGQLAFPKNSSEAVSFAVTLIQGLQRFPNLRALDLSGNLMGLEGSAGAQVIAENLALFPYLVLFNWRKNKIDSTDSFATQRLGQSLSSLPNLQFLFLRDNALGLTDSEGVQAIMTGLYTSSLFSGLPSPLLELDLGNNAIGSTGPEGPLLLGGVLPQLPNLQVLNVGGNKIGSTGPQGPDTILQGIVNSSQLLQLNVKGMTNVSFPLPGFFNPLICPYNQFLSASCYQGACTGAQAISFNNSENSLAQTPSYLSLLFQPTVQGQITSASGTPLLLNTDVPCPTSSASSRSLPAWMTLMRTLRQTAYTVGNGFLNGAKYGWDRVAQRIVDHCCETVEACEHSYFPQTERPYWGNHSSRFEEAMHGAVPTQSTALLGGTYSVPGIF